jgi:hypothetical protein
MRDHDAGTLYRTKCSCINLDYSMQMQSFNSVFKQSGYRFAGRKRVKIEIWSLVGSDPIRSDQAASHIANKPREGKFR